MGKDHCNPAFTAAMNSCSSSLITGCRRTVLGNDCGSGKQYGSCALLVDQGQRQGAERQHRRIFVAHLIGIPDVTYHHRTDAFQSVAVVILPPAFGKPGHVAPHVDIENDKKAVFVQGVGHRVIDLVQRGLNRSLKNGIHSVNMGKETAQST